MLGETGLCVQHRRVYANTKDDDDRGGRMRVNKVHSVGLITPWPKARLVLGGSYGEGRGYVVCSWGMPYHEGGGTVTHGPTSADSVRRQR